MSIKDIKSFTEREFENLCEFVCRRFSPGGQARVDRETMYFAIYWQLCNALGELLAAPDSEESLVGDYRERIGAAVGRIAKENFDAAGIADKVIAGIVESTECDWVGPFNDSDRARYGARHSAEARRYFKSTSVRFRRFGVNPN